MFTRRQLREKAMQTLYAYQLAQKAEGASPEETLNLAEKNLFKRIHHAYHLYLYNLYLLTKVAEYVEVEAQVVASKYLVSEEEKDVSQKILKNPVTQALIHDSSLSAKTASEEISHELDQQVVKRVFRQLREDNAYQDYLQETSTDERHKEMLKHLYRDVMLAHEDVHHHFEEIRSSWEDDIDMVANWVFRTIDRIEPDNGRDPLLSPYEKDWKNDKQFVSRLLRKTIQHRPNFDKMIDKKAKNWDVERITLIDRILMQMALCELLYFPDIPVKVSIDEYIEIAKYYSTPKSRSFINGILDRLMRELQKEGRIEKSEEGKQ